MAANSCNDLQHELNRHHHFQADFVQQVHSDDGLLLQKSKGHVWLQRPGTLKWQALSPEQHIVLLHGNHISLYQPDLKQLIVKKFDKAMADTPIDLLMSDNTTIQGRYRCQYQAGLWRLIPKHPMPLSHMVLHFEEEQLVRLSYVDRVGQSTHVAFHNLSTEHIPQQVFQLHVPKDTDIVQQ